MVRQFIVLMLKVHFNSSVVKERRKEELQAQLLFISKHRAPKLFADLFHEHHLVGLDVISCAEAIEV